MIVLQLTVIALFLIVLRQDYKDRRVSWFLFPLIGLLCFSIQLLKIGSISAIVNTVFNLIFTLLIVLVCFLYARWKLRRPFLKEVLGFGDILFFGSIAFAFSITSFLVLFIFSLFFSLMLHMALQNKQSDRTVPLAGYMSLFFGTVYLIDLIFNYPLLYTS
ncbi:hypothetical protein ACI6PS_07875 [Flavobacterium sp. PLA-1-15]|uniref:hypothetical protein n=1 Tax=Flavobacterium sp. PLA-1-15 TaxID=3380533 RepID=UPI003B7D456B